MRFIVLITGVAVASAASALDIGGRAAVGYSKLDTYPSVGEHTSAPKLELDLALDAGGFFERPGFLDWNLGASYRRVSAEVNGASTGESKLLLYRARAILFGDRRTPVTLTASALRNEARFLTDPQANVLGRAVVDSYGGDLSLNLRDRPQVSLGYSRLQTSDEVAGLTTHTSAADGFRAIVGHGSAAYNFIGTYNGTLGTGDWVSDNVDLHTGTAAFSFGLPGGLTAQVNDTYYLHIPRAAGAGAYRQENNSVGFFVSNNQGTGGRQTVRYGYAHGLTETSPTAFAELTRQSVRYDGEFALHGTPEQRGEPAPEGQRFSGRLLLDVGQSRTNAALVTSDSYGETLGATAYWRYGREGTYYEAHGGPSVALVQSELTGNDVGYGASLGGRIASEWLGQRLAFNYDADYGLRLYSSDGWTLKQSITGSVSGAIGKSRYVANLNGQSWRVSSPTLGDGAGRFLEARFVNTHRRLEAEIVGRLTDGIAAGTPREFVSDGLIIPAPFDSSTRELRVRSTYSVFTTLSVGAAGALISRVLPGAPSVTQAEVSGSIEYRFAAFSLRAEDRMVWYDQGSGGRNNLFFVHVSRRFGMRF
jgi:hypothetical protein